MKLVDGRFSFDDGQDLDLDASYGGLGLAHGGDLISGYDDRLWNTSQKLTPAQRREIAEYMVAQWKTWGGL